MSGRNEVNDMRANMGNSSRPGFKLGLVLSMLKGYGGLLFWTVLSGVGMHSCTIALAGVGAWTVGLAITGSPASELTPWLWLLAVLTIPLAVFPWLDIVLAHIMAFRILADMRVRIYDAFERLAPGYMLERRSGDLGAAAMGDVELLELGLSHTLPPLLVALIIPVGVTFVLYMQHPLLALAVAPFLIAGLAAPVMLERRSKGAGRLVRTHAGQAGAEVVDAIQGLREVLAFGAQETELNRLWRHEKALYRAQTSHGLTKARQVGVDLMIAGLAAATMAAVASWLTSTGEIPRNMLPVCVSLAVSTFLPLHTLMEAGRDFPTVISAMDRINVILQADPPVKDLVESPPPGPIEPRISFDGVRFKYQPHLPEALRGITFDVAAGETIALVGHSGAGKSTCANLVMRLWDVSEGRIAIGGHDLRDFPQEDLRRMISYVPQDVYLFNRPVRENIRLGRSEAGDDEVEKAAEAAQALEFIEALPQGWDTPIGERGVLLSGGQRQRIAIARAMLKNAPILVLDEAVSNLDAESEAAFQEAAARAGQGKTTLIIAHRLSTIRRAGRIVVIDKGEVAETGTHEELLKKNGVYARLIVSSGSGILD